MVWFLPKKRYFQNFVNFLRAVLHHKNAVSALKNLTFSASISEVLAKVQAYLA
jgi:hypothetical protein